MDYDALERLVRLRDSGAITESEFAEQRIILIEEGEGLHVYEYKNKQYPIKNMLILSGIVVVIAGFLIFSYVINTSYSPLNMLSHDEKLCQSAIKASLINPETAEFFEFQPVNREAYLSKFEENLRSEAEKEISSSNIGSGLSGIYAQAMESAANGIISRHVSEAVSRERTRISEENLRTFTYRIKADGQLGNTITSTQYCEINDTACTCM